MKRTPAGQAELAARLIGEMESNCAPETLAQILRACGRDCISENAIKTAMKLRESCKSLEETLKKLNEKHIGGGHLRLEGGRITAVYTSCYCGLAKAGKKKGLSPAYCQCSAGWFERLFSHLLGRPTAVTAVETILGGSARCLFHIE